LIYLASRRGFEPLLVP